MVNYLDSRRIMGTTAERSSIPVPATQGGWVELGRTTLGSAGDDIDVTSISDKRYYMVLHDLIASGDITPAITFNNDSGSNYSSRREFGGVAEATSTSRSSCLFDSLGGTYNKFFVEYIANYSANEKLEMNWGVFDGGAGASNDPDRQLNVNKWTNTSSVISRIDNHNTAGGGDYASGSEVVVLGWDPDDTHTNNFWEELVDANSNGTGDVNTGTFTAKKYLWIQVWLKNTDATTTAFAFRTGNATIDTGTNYARRYSSNGAADGTSTSSNHFDFTASAMAQNTTAFANILMVNNSAYEKLIIGHSIHQTASGAGTAPERKEFVTKWANTSNQANIFGITDLGTSSTFDYHIKIWGAD